MKKENLHKLRKEKNYSQEYMATQLNMDTASYNRREKGKTPIDDKEWQKIAAILEVPVEQIKEDDNKYMHILVENLNGHQVNGDNNSNHLYNIPKELWDTQNKYIKKLESENEKLQQEIERLKLSS